MTVQSQVARYAVFATARFSHAQIASGHAGRGPQSLVHAKTMGTMSTLCGQSTFSWFKFWDLAFTSVRLDRCPSCSSALVATYRAGKG
jgi:hypothetical protein